MARWTKQQQEDARERLADILRENDTLYTVLRHRSRSGMARWLDVYAFLPCPERGDRAVEKYRLSYLVANATGYAYDRRHEAIRVNGCGFDVGHDVVYSLSMALFGHGQHGLLRHEWIG